MTLPQPDYAMALPVPDPESLDDDLKAYFAKCQEKLGLVPNVLRSYSARPEKLRTFIKLYNELMLGDSGLDKLEREMIAVVVSSPTTATTASSPMGRRCGNCPAIRNWARCW